MKFPAPWGKRGIVTLRQANRVYKTIRATLFMRKIRRRNVLSRRYVPAIYNKPLARSSIAEAINFVFYQIFLLNAFGSLHEKRGFPMQCAILHQIIFPSYF